MVPGLWAYNKSTAFVSHKFVSKVCTPSYNIRKVLTSITYTSDDSPAGSIIGLHGRGRPETIADVSAYDRLYGTWRSLSVSTNSSRGPKDSLLSLEENGIEQYWETDRLVREIEQKYLFWGLKSPDNIC